MTNQKKLIEDLLERYFDGETTLEEEKFLKDNLDPKKYPEEYKLFQAFEALKLETTSKNFDELLESKLEKSSARSKKNWGAFEYLSIAASILILFGAIFIFKYNQSPDKGGLTINNQNYAQNQAKAQKHIQEAFDAISENLQIAQKKISKLDISKILDKTVQIKKDKKSIKGE